MQVCTYLDRRFVTSLLSRPNCFSNKKKASTICYAQPVKENKSLVVRSPCPSISSSMSLWRLLLKWQQRKNHRLSISFQPQSNLVLKYILYDTFSCWQNQDLQLWKIICTCFNFLPLGRRATRMFMYLYGIWECMSVLPQNKQYFHWSHNLWHVFWI